MQNAHSDFGPSASAALGGDDGLRLLSWGAELRHAARTGDTSKMCTLLLDHSDELVGMGAPDSKRGEFAVDRVCSLTQVTALHEACFGGSQAAVQILCDVFGADCNACDADGRTALWYALLGGHVQVGRWILESRRGEINLHACDHRSGNTLLHEAVERADLLWVQLLLREGMAPLCLNVSGESASAVLRARLADPDQAHSLPAADRVLAVLAEYETALAAGWSPATHRYFAPGARASARTLLLLGSVRSCKLAALPRPLLLYCIAWILDSEPETPNDTSCCDSSSGDS